MFPKIALHVSLWGDDWSIVQWANAEEKEIANLRSIFDAAMNAGLNFWMADWSAYGKSEELLGAFLKTVQREDYYLSSEFKPAMSGLASKEYAAPSDEASDKMFAASARRLHTIFFNVYWLNRYYEAWLGQLMGYAKAGRIERIGLYSSSLEYVQERWEVLRAEGLDAPAVRGRYSFFDRKAESSGLLEWCEDHYTKFFAGLSYEDYEKCKELDKIPEFTKIAKAHDLTTLQVVYSWAVAKGAVPIMSANSLGSIDKAVRIANAELRADEITALENITKEMH